MHILSFERFRSLAYQVVLVAIAAVASQTVGYGQDQPSQEVHAGELTLASVADQLRLYPRDPYLQYVAMQLNYRETGMFGSPDDLTPWLRQRQLQSSRNSSVDLFSIFSGGLALQESLQLDAMTGGGPQTQQDARIAIKSLEGPTIKSHPWAEMLGSAKPKISKLALCVPEDYLFIRFRSVSKLMETTNLIDSSGAYVISQLNQSARSQLVIERIKSQLAVEANALLGPVYDSVVQELAIVSSDMFFREGTDVTLLFELKQPGLFREQMDASLNNAAKSAEGATRTKGELLGVEYEHVATSDRSVHVYSAYPKPELHVRTNSLTALESILGAIAGKSQSGKKVARLGESDEFKYIRTIMPEEAAEEDGFVYMSDPFIRRLMGPQVKLTQRRRLMCYNHLRMLGHASLLHTAEHGHMPKDISELKSTECLPKGFGDDRCTCPDGGTYSLSKDGLTAECSHHGPVHAMNPAIETPISKITAQESEEYKQFLERYNQYWRTFFDPIAIRIQLQPQAYRIETIILPLIDNSIYSGLASALGGDPQPLDALPVPKRNIFSMNVKLDKAKIIEQSQLNSMLPMAGVDAPAEEAKDRDRSVSIDARMRELGLLVMNFEAAHGHFPPLPVQNPRRPSGLSWRVHVLPFLNEAELYAQFKLDEPWDSEHNSKLIAKMPRVFMSDNRELNQQGKTKYLMPVADDAILSGTVNAGGERGRRIAEITDGTSGTALLLHANDEHAVVWTKPEDLEIDLRSPDASLEFSEDGRTPALMVDGSLVRLPIAFAKAELAKLITCAGAEPWQDLSPYYVQYDSRMGRSGFEDRTWRMMNQLYLQDFLMKGIGEQLSVNICDADPLVDFNVSRFLGMMMGSFQGSPERLIGNGEGIFALLAISINVPVYVAIPVNDTAIVDRSLEGLDRVLAYTARQETGGFSDFFEIDQDYYLLETSKDKVDAPKIRSYGFRFGPLKWRFYWSRIENGLYVASKPFLLQDIIEATEASKSAADDREIDDGPTAHGMIRVRPENWNATLPQFRLGWAENQRQACLHNIGPLSSVAQALSHMQAGGDVSKVDIKQVEEMAEQVLNARLFCPDGGHYHVDEDGHSIRCSKHGTAMAPRQSASPDDSSKLGGLMSNLDDVTLALTFLADGLHAVVTIKKE